MSHEMPILRSVRATRARLGSITAKFRLAFGVATAVPANASLTALTTDLEDVDPVAIDRLI